MLLRFILWTILIFIAAKILGGILRYLRRALTPNLHVKNQRNQSKVEESKDVEDIPYEDISNKQ